MVVLNYPLTQNLHFTLFTTVEMLMEVQKLQMARSFAGKFNKYGSSKTTCGNVTLHAFGSHILSNWYLEAL